MKTSHTPGPWEIEEYDRTLKEKYYSRVSDKTSINIFSRINSLAEVLTTNVGWNEAEANARLIAAAPDMLEALERVIKWHESGCDISRKTLLNIEALIAKVKND